MRPKESTQIRRTSIITEDGFIRIYDHSSLSDRITINIQPSFLLTKTGTPGGEDDDINV